MTVVSDLEKRALPRGEEASRERAYEALWARLGPHAHRLRLRRGQNLSVAGDGEATILLPRSGALLLHVTMPGTQRQVVGLLLPGDVLRSSGVPPAASGALTAASQSELWRFRASAIEELSHGDARLGAFFRDAAALQAARGAIHLAAIGRFTGEQRVATVLIDLAMRTGSQSPRGGLVLEMPFSRTDIADYLGLNPDTLSRIMSRLRGSGILGPSERSRAIVRDFRALADLSPASRSLFDLYGDRRD